MFKDYPNSLKAARTMKKGECIRASFSLHDINMSGGELRTPRRNINMQDKN